MIIKETNLNVADNSGARKVRVFNLYGGSRRNASGVGDVVLCAVKEAIPNGKVKFIAENARFQKLFEQKNLLKENLTLFDAFCGTGAIAYHFKNEYNLIINDNLHCATTFASGRVFASQCTFEKIRS